jgi:uncharacterized protein YndB with AHSA1/START domain
MALVRAVPVPARDERAGAGGIRGLDAHRADGPLGDHLTIENEILAFEPPRMMAIRIRKPPSNFPFKKDAWKRTWTVLTLTPVGDGRTHVRAASLGYGTDAESVAMRRWQRRHSGHAGLTSRADAAHAPNGS